MENFEQAKNVAGHELTVHAGTDNHKPEMQLPEGHMPELPQPMPTPVPNEPEKNKLPPDMIEDPQKQWDEDDSPKKDTPTIH